MSRRPNYAARRFLVFVIAVIVLMLAVWGAWALEEYHPVHNGMHWVYEMGLHVRHAIIRFLP